MKVKFKRTIGMIGKVFLKDNIYEISKDEAKAIGKDYFEVLSKEEKKEIKGKDKMIKKENVEVK